jgi:hypothetical protein
MQTMRAILLAVPCLLIAVLSYAQPANFNQAQSPPSTNNKPTHTKETGKVGQDAQSSPPSLPSTNNITVAGKLEPASDREKAKAPEYQQEWFGEFFNVKATDYVIAFFTVVIGIFTFYLYRATEKLAHISSQQERSTRTIERAYVRLSHLESGIKISLLGTAEGNFRIKNFGQTPARITSIVLDRRLMPGKNPLPAIPDYAGMEEKVIRAFLVRDDELFFYRHFTLGGINDDLEREIQTLWFYGYIDYRDQFGERYRAGYASRYQPGSATDNLAMEALDGYNYDRPRKPDEGHDWNEP